MNTVARVPYCGFSGVVYGASRRRFGRGALSLCVQSGFLPENPLNRLAHRELPVRRAGQNPMIMKGSRSDVKPASVAAKAAIRRERQSNAIVTASADDRTVVTL